MPTRLPAIIDGLTLTVPIPSEREQRLLKRWLDEGRGYEPLEEGAKRKPPSKRYRHWYWIAFGERGQCLVELSPRGFDGNYMRLDFNPAGQVVAMRQVLDRLREGLPRLGMTDLCRSRITRVDIAVDVTGLTLDQVDAFGMLRRRPVRAWQTKFAWEPKSRLTGIEIGDNESDTTLTVYDKAAEGMFRQREGVPRLIRSRVRFELRLRDRDSVHSILERENPFLRYTVIRRDDAALRPQDSLQRFFALAVRAYGAQVVLSTEPVQRRRDALRELLQTPPGPDYWDAHACWQEFSTAWRTMFEL